MEEIWKDIVGYEGLYQVSNLGNIKSLPKQWKCGGSNAPLKEFSHNGKILKPLLSSNGYCGVCLYKNNKVSRLSVHRTVADAFIDNFGNKPQVNHINGIKTDNRAENLEWATNSENIQHAIQHGLIKSGYKNPGSGLKGEKNHSSKFLNSEVVELRKLINSKLYTQKQLASVYGVTQATISVIKLGKVYGVE